jgi:hypothetical protein
MKAASDLQLRSGFNVVYMVPVRRSSWGPREWAVNWVKKVERRLSCTAVSLDRKARKRSCCGAPIVFFAWFPMVCSHGVKEAEKCAVPSLAHGDTIPR